jgi:hypothetical protein
MLVRRQNLPVPEAVIFDMDSTAAKTPAADGNTPAAVHSSTTRTYRIICICPASGLPGPD